MPSIASLNELRRKALDEISSKIVNKFVKKSNLSDNQIKEIIEKEINTSK